MEDKIFREKVKSFRTKYGILSNRDFGNLVGLHRDNATEKKFRKTYPNMARMLLVSGDCEFLESFTDFTHAVERIADQLLENEVFLTFLKEHPEIKSPIRGGPLEKNWWELCRLQRDNSALTQKFGDQAKKFEVSEEHIDEEHLDESVLRIAGILKIAPENEDIRFLVQSKLFHPLREGVVLTKAELRDRKHLIQELKRSILVFLATKEPATRREYYELLAPEMVQLFLAWEELKRSVVGVDEINTNKGKLINQIRSGGNING